MAIPIANIRFLPEALTPPTDGPADSYSHRKGRYGYSELLQLRAASRALTDVHGFVPFQITLPGTESTSLQATRVSPGLLPMLGARPALGRLFVENDQDAIVLSETVWDRYFARSPDLVGRRVLSADRQVSFTVVGVVADRFHFPNAQTHAWARLSLEEAAVAVRL